MKIVFRTLLALATGWAILAGTVQPTSWAAPFDLQQDVFLNKLAEDTWTYLSSDWATDNHLPWSWRSFELSGGDYANTTEIGLYMLAYLAAYDLHRVWSPTWLQAEIEVISTLDQLRAWQTGSQAVQTNGPNAYNNSVFYQWYWVNRDPPIVGASDGDHVVPSIDNAFLAASLITIREYGEANGHAQLAQKANAILADVNLRLWYDSGQHLFQLGSTDEPLGGAWADFYSNENRIVNFVAYALGDLSADELRNSLDALSKPSAVYGNLTVDKVSWDGSYFTYIAPALFIRERETFYNVCTLDPATRAQIKYAQDMGYPVWGFSDCFDIGSGGYVQQGSPPTAKGGAPQSRPGLVTPHASAMALITDHYEAALNNLKLLSTEFPGLYHPEYGFRDSVMAAPAVTGYGDVSLRFSALAQEWLFLSIVNAQTGFIWKYFYRDESVAAAHLEMFSNTAGCSPVCSFSDTVLCGTE